MTVEELEIIIRANIKDAIGPIKQIVKEVKGAVSNSIKPMNEIATKTRELASNSATSVAKAKTQLKQFESAAKTTAKKINKEMNIDFSVFSSDGTVEQLKAKIEGLKAVREQIYKNNPEGLFSDNAKKQLDEVVFKLIEIEEKIKEIGNTSNGKNIDVLGNNVPTTAELPTFDMHEVSNQNVEISTDFNTATTKEQIKIIIGEIENLLPFISKIKEEVKNTVNDSTSLLHKIVDSTKNIAVSFNYLRGEVYNKISGIKNDVSAMFKNLSSIAKDRMQPIVNVASHIGKAASGSFNIGIGNIKEKLDDIGKTKIGSFLKNSFLMASNGAKKLIDKIRGIDTETKKTRKNGNGFGEGITKGVSKGIKSLKRFALSLLSIRTAFSAVSKAAQAYLSFDKQLSESIQNSWNVLGSLLAPALEFVASLFAKLVSYIAAFVKALTGIDLVARANAKALDKQSKSAKKASEAQLGIDEFHSVNNDGGGDSASLKVEDIDTKKFDGIFSMLNKIKEIFSELFAPFKNAWEKYGKLVIESFKNAFLSIGNLGSTVFQSLFEIWTNGTGQTIVENVLLGWTQIFDIISALSDAFNNAWISGGSGISILQSLADILIIIQGFGLSIGDSLRNWFVSPSFTEALSRIFSFTSDIFKMLKDVGNWLLKMYDTYVKPVIDEKLLPAIDEIIIAISDIWNVVKPVIDFIIEYVEAVLEPVIKGLMDFIGGIIDVVRGIAKFISGVFTGDWRKAWDGIKQIFKGFCDAIGSFFKTPINIIIASFEFCANKIIWAFNKIKKMLNKLSFDIPDWVPVIGGQTWGFDFKMTDELSIPRLYNGGAVLEDSIVRVADYPNSHSNPEIVSPRNMMKETFKEAMEESNNSKEPQRVEADVTGELRIDGNDLVIVYDKNKKEKGYDGGKKPSFIY